MIERHRPQARFGLFIGQVGLSWEELAERFELADELGFDHAWLVDHLMPTDPPHDRACFESWTSLAALAALTHRVHLGVLVSSVTFRHPSLLAKQAVTVDHISGGRLILGIGSGWYAEEHQRFGIPFAPAAERIDRLDEAIGVMTALMSGEAASYGGRYYQLDKAVALPPPANGRHIPILIAAHRPRMLTLAARHADVWDTFASLPGTATADIPTSLADRVAHFERASREAGRDPATIRRSTWVGTEAFQSLAAYTSFVKRHRAIGFTDLVASLPSRAAWPTVRRVAKDLIPSLRQGKAAPAQRPTADRPTSAR